MRLVLSIGLIIGLSFSLFAKTKSGFKKDNYHFIYNAADSLLVQKLFVKVQPPLRRIESFFGQKPASVITIYLARSDEDYYQLAPAKLPEWSQAVAFVNQRLILLKLSAAEDILKSPQIFLHELVHIFVAEHFPAQRIPAWLNEGLAEYLSGEQLTLQKKVVIANALAAKEIIEFKEFAGLINFEAPKAKLAYAEALSVVEYFIRLHGETGLHELLAELKKQRSVNEAFKSAAGYDLVEFEANWHEYLANNYRWLVILNLDHFLWVIIVILAILTIIVIQYRNRLKLKKWELAERETEG